MGATINDHAGMVASHLVVTTDGHEWTLIGHPLGGTHPKPRQAWHVLHQIDDPFAWAPRPALAVYVGNGLATVRGIWHGRPVDIKVGQWNPYAAGRWNRLAALVDPYNHHPPSSPMFHDREPYWGADVRDEDLGTCALCVGDPLPPVSEK